MCVCLNVHVYCICFFVVFFFKWRQCVPAFDLGVTSNLVGSRAVPLSFKNNHLSCYTVCISLSFQIFWLFLFLSLTPSYFLPLVCSAAGICNDSRLQLRLHLQLHQLHRKECTQLLGLPHLLLPVWCLQLFSEGGAQSDIQFKWLQFNSSVPDQPLVHISSVLCCHGDSDDDLRGGGTHHLCVVYNSRAVPSTVAGHRSE